MLCGMSAIVRMGLGGLASWRQLVALIVVLVGCLLIGLSALHAASPPQPPLTAGDPVVTATRTPHHPSSRGVSGMALMLPETAGLPAPHRARRKGDVTLGDTGTFTFDHTRSALFTPDPRYTAQDTLTDTGPGLPGPLTGLPTRAALAQRRPIAVVIDNYAPDARPQAGLNRASLVFETVAEGGITRFMAVYLEKDAPVIGPVRSARIYFDAWAAGLQAIYAHAGGNNDALAEIPSISSIANVDGLGAGTAFWRSDDRLAPHNLYTDTRGLRASGNDGTNVQTPVLPHKAPAALQARPKHGWIHIEFSGPDYAVQYRYDPICNCYLRSMGGQPHRDAFSHRQIAPANVVVLFAGVVADPASDTPGSVSVQTSGEGQALYFRDGGLVQGTWQKASETGPLVLLDAQSRPVALDPGQTWFEVVPIGNPVTWSLK